MEKAESEEFHSQRKRKSATKQPEKYFEKYAKLLGEESGLDAAKIAKSNEAYGMGKLNLVEFIFLINSQQLRLIFYLECKCMRFAKII